MRQHGDIYLVEIHAQGFDVVLELIGVIAGVKENSLTVVMDESGKAPVQNCSSLLIAKRVVQIENRVLISRGQMSGWILRQQQEGVTDEQQGDRSRDISHSKLRGNFAANSISGLDQGGPKFWRLTANRK